MFLCVKKGKIHRAYSETPCIPPLRGQMQNKRIPSPFFPFLCAAPFLMKRLYFWKDVTIKPGFPSLFYLSWRTQTCLISDVFTAQTALQGCCQSRGAALDAPPIFFSYCAQKPIRWQDTQTVSSCLIFFFWGSTMRLLPIKPLGVCYKSALHSHTFAAVEEQFSGKWKPAKAASTTVMLQKVSLQTGVPDVIMQDKCIFV